jgi:hypothetical protein
MIFTFHTDTRGHLQPMVGGGNEPFFAEVSAASPERNMHARRQRGGKPAHLAAADPERISTLH